ncbi:hypothetical protein [Bacillus taeanensis]|uniref:MotA/TolQ/ExbB proton channel domain-containing protein n=1 Tax=Bacillus taeanensis TaxID=273032 RepID=A0A366Y227_9BACI|nr:hypothetical protein [Bacillus taeanensis]RBW70463.1 hypothetical protein DS031_05395 [Bacillus taeanensis]
MFQLTNIILSIIGFIVLFSVISHFQLMSQLKGWLKEIESISSKHIESPHLSIWLQLVIDDYKTHHLSGVYPLNTGAIIEKHLFFQKIRLFGIFSVPIGNGMRLLQQLPSAAIITGILGTFIGLTLAIQSMQETLLLISNNANEQLTIQNILSSISSPFQGMSLAFITSIAGIGGGLFLSMLHAGYFSGGKSLLYLQNQIYSSCENLLDHQLQGELQNEKPKDSMEKLLDRLVTKVQESFQQSIGSFGEQMVDFTIGLKTAMDDVKGIFEEQRIFTERFSEASSKLQQFGETFSHTTQTLNEIQTTTSNSYLAVKTSIDQFTKQIKENQTKLDHGQRRFEQLLERSDQVLKDGQQKFEQLTNLSLRGLEEQLERFHQRTEEQERRLQDKNDEWYYRYQEKQDHYTRAAQDFAASVQQLEKAWQSAVERVKRDFTEQLNYSLERHRDLNSRDQFNQQELRQIVHQMAEMQQNLTRGLKEIQHYLAEENQILYRLVQIRNQENLSQTQIPSRIIE